MKKLFPVRIQMIVWASCAYMVFILSQCISPLDIDIPKQEPLLVIDGLLTDKPGPYTVKLSFSSPISNFSSNPVSEAKVSIEEEGGIIAELTETEEGTYVSNSLEIQGKVGRNYRLLVSLETDRNYQSSWVTLKAAPPIGDIYYEFGPLANQEVSVHGVQIFLDTNDPENKTHFYRWEWEDTWIHVAPYASGLIFLGNDEAEQGPANRVCFNNSQSHSIYIASSLDNSEDVISKFHLAQVSGFGSQLRYRYSLLVKQYALDENEYLFWKNVQEANQNSGGLFDRQPQSNLGNVFRVEDKGEAVLGYFGVSGYQEKRLFISRSELPPLAALGEQYIKSCTAKADTLFKGLETDQDVFDAISRGRDFYTFHRDPDIVGWVLATKDCTDCTTHGGTTQVPDFW